MYNNLSNLHLIVALAQNNAIGFKNRLLYHLPLDLRHFKHLTTGHTIIMGKNTYLSLPKGVLPNRRNIVLSSSLSQIEGGEVYTSLQEALNSCSSDKKVFIIGGAKVYEEALPLCQHLHLTLIEDTPKEADVFFPTFNLADWKEVSCESHQSDEKHAFNFHFKDFIRQ